MKINKTNLFFFTFVFLITPFIFWPGLPSGLMLDDGPQLIQILQQITAENWPTKYKEYIFSNSGHFSRPIPMATFIFNAVISGKDIWYWKLTNVIFHILSAFTVFLLTRNILLFNKNVSSSKLTMVCLSISILWLVHPLHVSTVLYLVQRMAILTTLFVFSALTCFIYGVKKECNHENGKYYFFSSLFIFFPLSILSKESGILFPVYALLLNQYLSHQSIYTDRVKQRIRPYIISLWSIIICGFIGFIYYFDSLILDAYHFREFTLTERLLTQSRVIFLYLYQIIIPIPSSMGFFHDDILLSKSLFYPYITLFSVIGIFVTSIFLILNFKKLGLFAFGILFFLSSHLIESTFFPLEIAFEHRNYIGSWGVILAVVYSLFKLTKKTFTASIIIIALLLSGLTFYRSSIWGNPNLMYPHMLAIHPQSKRLKIIFADTYFKAGQYDVAYHYLDNVKGLGAELQRLDIQCIQSKTIENNQLLNLIKKHHKIGTYEMEGIITLANRGLDAECKLDKQTFILFLHSVLQYPIVNKVAEQKVLLYKAHYHYALGQFKLALSSLEDSFAKDTSNPIPLFLKIDWLIEAKLYKEAKLVFVTAKKSADRSLFDYAEFISNADMSLAQHD
jgi:hypothetical protein